MTNKLPVLFFIFLITLSCGDDHNGQNQQADEVKSNTSGPEKRLLNPDEFEQIYSETPDAHLLDIRTNMEVKKGYIEGMNQVDFFRDDFYKVVENRFDKEKPMFVYCGIGGRSAECVKELRAAGFKKIYDMDGGFKAWEKAGKPIKK